MAIGTPAETALFYTLLVATWVLYVLLCVGCEPGYIGFPEPPAADRRLCKRLAALSLGLNAPPLQHNLNNWTTMWRRGEAATDSSESMMAVMDQQPVDIDTDGIDQDSDAEVNAILRGDRRGIRRGVVTLAKFGDVPRRMCDLCRVKQPLRTRHCFTCGQCVLRFDHHCPFTGMCIGQDNHFVFWCWLLLQNVVDLWALAKVSVGIVVVARQVADTRTSVIMVMLSMSLAFLFCVSLLVLSVWAYQTYIISTNQLTYENIRVVGKVHTWPWYFRYFINGDESYTVAALQSPDTVKADLQAVTIQADVQSAGGCLAWRTNRPFDRGLCRNWIGFICIAINGLRNNANRTWRTRYRLDGTVVASYAHRISTASKGKGRPVDLRCRPDGWLCLYYDEVGAWPIPSQFFDSLRREVLAVKDDIV